MASSSKSSRVVGEYLISKQIGSGSFSVVWEGRHKIENTQVAIKEIAMGRLNGKLQESLMSEISILKHISHPNIIRLLHIIQAPGKIYLVLEFCRGGDLSMFLNRHGRVPEATAKHFMHQLAAGLKVLRDNNLIHRDLKPQNLLLSTDDANSALKIADFGFARSLQPWGLAETMCGSPLYMAPEIMQLQKYDAKADLWSVGAILFQLVTGKTPFTGSNQIQLLQNIMKSNELHFPSDCATLSPECKDLCRKLLRRNPVERLTFEEFFNHAFLSHGHVQSNQPLSRSSTRTLNSFPSSDRESGRDTEESSQEECLPFHLDDDSSGPDGSPSSLRRRSTLQTTYGFSIDSREHSRAAAVNAAREADRTSRYSSSTNNPEDTVLGSNRHGISQTLDGPQNLLDQRSRALDSMEWDQEYVFVPGPPLDMSSSSAIASKRSYVPHKAESPQASVTSKTTATAPLPIKGAAASKTHYIGSFESQSSAPATSLGSADIGDIMEQPSSNGMTRIRSLQECASAITEIVNEKLKEEKQLEAFSVQLVILAIWKQALHICHTQAASAMEGSPSQGTTRLRRSSRKMHSSPEAVVCDPDIGLGPDDLSSQIEREFLREVEHAEELAKFVEPGNTEMPDAMETIFQSALVLGRRGGVDELMGNMETAVLLYSKAVRLLVFLLVEAPSLILNPPFSITNSDRYRLRTYIDILNNRQDYSRSQRMVLLKCGSQQSSS